MNYGRKGHEEENEVELCLKSAFILHEMLKHPKHKRMDIFIEEADKTDFDHEVLKEKIKELKSKTTKRI